MEFRRFVDAIDAAVPVELDAHLILRQLCHSQDGTHLSFAGVASALSRVLHTDGFVLAPSGREMVRVVDGKTTQARVYRSTRELEETIARYVESTNTHPKPFVWTESTDGILASLHRFCIRKSDSGHQTIIELRVEELLVLRLPSLGSLVAAGFQEAATVHQTGHGRARIRWRAQ